MNKNIIPDRSFKDFIMAIVILIIVGIAGLALVTTQTLPTLGPRWLFFFFLILLSTGLALPIVYYLNLRFPSVPIAEKIIVIRQAIWVGIYVALLAWLQMGRVLSFPLAIIIGAAFLMIELFLRLWERSHWKPQEPNL